MQAHPRRAAAAVLPAVRQRLRAKKTVNPFRFIGEVRQEGRKVTWTSRNETIVSSIFVLVMATLAAIFFFGVDSFIGMVINFLLGLGA